MNPAPPPLPITLLVMTYNEAHSIARCLDSVGFAAEKIVIDSDSEDETRELAMLHGARVVVQPWLGFGAQRNFATTQAANEWILFLDADESLSPALAAELQRELPALLQSDAAVGTLRRSAAFMGQPLRWYRPKVRERQTRIYHRDRARWSDVRVHESLRFRGRAVAFRAPLLHDHDPTLVHAELKALKYAELKARDWAGRGRRTSPWAWPAVFLGTFLKDYLLRLAFLDGWRGLAVAYLAAHYALYKRLRFEEMRRYPESVILAEAALRQHRLER